MGAATAATATIDTHTYTHTFINELDLRIGNVSASSRICRDTQTHTLHTPKIFSIHFTSYRVILGCYKLN